MKYQALYELVRERGHVVVSTKEYPASIVMPIKGYAVPATTDVVSSFSLNDDERIIRHMFDLGIGYVIDDRECDHFQVRVDRRYGFMYIEWAEVFGNKTYAMGYAHAIGSPFILDLFTNKAIVRKEK